MSANEYFTTVLGQIFQSQQGFTVKTSIYLKKIDEYLFAGKNQPTVKSDDAELLYLGIPDKKYQGLFHIAGTKSTFGSLKKSSYYALDIIEKTTSKGKNKDVFQKVFIDCDQQDFRHLLLATHITDAKNNASLQLCALLKSRRPFLNESDYIFGTDARKIFEKWYETNKKKKAKIVSNVEKQKKSLAFEASQTNDDAVNTFKSNPMMLLDGLMKMANIGTNLQELEFYEDYIIDEVNEYYLDTFLDPIDILVDKKDSEQERDTMVFKRFMHFLIQTPVTKVCQSIIEKHIQSIHMESQQFSPETLIHQFHKKLNDSQKSALSKTIPLHFGVEYRRNLTKFYFDRLVQLSKNVNQVKQNFVQNQTIRNDASVGFSLRTQMKHSMKNLCEKVQPLSKKYEESQKLRKLIVFLQANPEFVKLPMLIKKNLDENNIIAIESLYKKYQILIEAYKETPVIRDITDEIQSVLRNARYRQIEIAIEKNYNTEQLQILIGLFPNKAESLVEYIVPKLVYHLIKQIDPLNNNEAIHKMENKIQKYQLINFGKSGKGRSNKVNMMTFSSSNGEMDEGDGLEEFLQQLNQEKSIILKGLELKDKIKEKFKNFFQMKKKWAVQYNCFFFQLKFLIQAMTSWYGNMINEIIEEKAYDLVHVTSEMLIIAENNAQDPMLLQSISKLKQSNFEVYCTMITEKTRSSVEFKKCPIRKDTDGNYFNGLTTTILDSIIENVSEIIKFPSFVYKDKYILRLYKYFQDCLVIQQNKLITLPQIFTYSAMISCIMESEITKPFYEELAQFQTLRKHLNQYLKKLVNKVDSLLYSIIKIEYRSTINRHKKQGNFAFPILEYLNDCCFLITQYACINYKRHSRFVIEGFQQIANEASAEMIKDAETGKVFVRQLELIKAMTNRINSKRIAPKWDHLLKLVVVAGEEKSQKEMYILENKHKLSSNFCGLMDY